MISDNDGVPSVLRTERTTLRPWTVDDAGYYFDILGRRTVTQWLGEPEPLANVRAARRRIERVENYATPRVPGARAIVPDEVGYPVGAAMLGRLPDDEEIQVGWYLHPDHTGQGYVTEAARAVLDEALACGHRRIWAGMWPHNEASASVCRRLGMTDLGEQVDPWYGTIEYPTSRMFCIWRSDGPDDADPLELLAERVARATFEHATDHPPE